MDDRNSSLAQSLENLYSVFSVYPLRPVVEGCPHCVGEKAEAHLHRAPLRELTAEDLESFASKAMTTWGDSVDYRHFLPRIVELSLAEPPCSGLEPWLIGSKLTYANWSQWPRQEIGSIIQFIESAWLCVIAFPPEEQSAVSTGPVRWAADAALALQADALEDVSRLLQIWDAADEIEPQLHPSMFAQSEAPYFAKKRKLGLSLTVESSLALEQITAWLKNPSLVSALITTFEKEIEGHWSNTLAAGIDALQWIQQVEEDG